MILVGAALFGQQSYRVILGGYRTGHLEEEAQKAPRRVGSGGSRKLLRDPHPTKRITLLRGRELPQDPVGKMFRFETLSRLEHRSCPVSRMSCTRF